DGGTERQPRCVGAAPGVCGRVLLAAARRARRRLPASGGHPGGHALRRARPRVPARAAVDAPVAPPSGRRPARLPSGAHDAPRLPPRARTPRAGARRGVRRPRRRTTPRRRLARRSRRRLAVVALRADPALAIVRLAWPVLDLWHDPRAVPAESLATTVRVWRGGGFRVFHAALDPRAARALEGLVAGQPLGAVCGNFGGLPAAEAAERATGLLARWLEDGLLACYVLPG